MLLMLFLYMQTVHTFHNTLPYTLKLFHSLDNNTGLDWRFKQEEVNEDQLLRIKQNIARINLLRTLEDTNIHDVYKIDRIKHFDFILNITERVSGLYAGGLMLEHDDFNFDFE